MQCYVLHCVMVCVIHVCVKTLKFHSSLLVPKYYKISTVFWLRHCIHSCLSLLVDRPNNFPTSNFLYITHEVAIVIDYFLDGNWNNLWLILPYSDIYPISKDVQTCTYVNLSTIIISLRLKSHDDWLLVSLLVCAFLRPSAGG